MLLSGQGHLSVYTDMDSLALFASLVLYGQIYRYQANRSFLISRMNKYMVKIVTGAVKAEGIIQRIVSAVVKVRSQKQPDRKYSHKKKQSHRKHHNNRKPCL